MKKLMCVVVAVGFLLSSCQTLGIGPPAAPEVAVRDQSIEEGTVTVRKVVSDGPGWVVVHADDSGRPGAVLGYTQVRGGSARNVPVTIGAPATSETLLVVLYYDRGTLGTFEVPGADRPVKVAGEVLVVSFSVTR